MIKIRMNFIEYIIPTIMAQYNPLNYKYEDESGKKYVLNLVIKNHRIVYPKVCDNDGTVNELTSSLSRLRNYTYSLSILTNISIKIVVNSDNITMNYPIKYINNVLLGKIPIVVKSNYCITKRMCDNECKYDPGGYVIINGNGIIIAKDLKGPSLQRFLESQKK